jgi:hypothetical protein
MAMALEPDARSPYHGRFQIVGVQDNQWVAVRPPRVLERYLPPACLQEDLYLSLC